MIFTVCTYITLFHSQIGEASPGTPLLWPDHEFNTSTARIGEKFGGVDVFQVYADGDKKDASGDAEPVRRMEEFERFMEANTDLGATVSVVPFLKAYGQQNHFGDPKWSFIPNDSASVRSALFQLRQNGAPGFLRPFMTDDGRYANLSFIYRDHKGDTLMRVVQAAEDYVRENPIGEVIVRLEKDKAPEDATWLDGEKWADATYYLFGPLLPARDHTLKVKLRKDGRQLRRGGSGPRSTGTAACPPGWASSARRPIADYEEERDAVEEGDFFSWPETSAAGADQDVEWWWENEEFGIRAVAMDETNLIVHDLKAVEGEPKYQQTNRGRAACSSCWPAGSWASWPPPTRTSSAATSRTSR